MNLVASGLGKPKNSRGGEPVINDQSVEGAGDQPAQEAGQDAKAKIEQGRRLAHCWRSSLCVNMRPPLHNTSECLASVRRTQRKSGDVHEAV